MKYATVVKKHFSIKTQTSVASLSSSNLIIKQFFCNVILLLIQITYIFFYQIHDQANQFSPLSLFVLKLLPYYKLFQLKITLLTSSLIDNNKWSIDISVSHNHASCLYFFQRRYSVYRTHLTLAFIFFLNSYSW